MNRICKENKLGDLGKKAAKRKIDPKHRHIPCDSDIAITNEHAKLLEAEQYKAIASR